MSNQQYCSRCVLKSSNPGIHLDDQGLCNICNGHEFDYFTKNMGDSLKQYKGFKEEMAKNRGQKRYDCMVMFSGGKDSIYILQKLVQEEKLNVLAVTINLPFETSKSKESIEHVVAKLNVDHIAYTPKTDQYKALMSAVFSQKYQGESIQPERITKFEHLSPCVMCTGFIKITSCLLAAKLDIPYVLYCADPGQMANLSINLENVIRPYLELFDQDLIERLFGADLSLLDPKVNSQAPRVIYPYIAMPDYNPEKIIAKLTELGLYELKPQEGHCRLWSLLNYFAIKKYDSPFYILDYATDVRTGNMNRQETIQFIEYFKQLMLQIGSNGEVSPAARQQLQTVLQNAFPEEAEFNYVYQNILEMAELAAELGLDLQNL